MQIKTKALIVTCLCLAGLGGFLVSTGGTDKDSVVDNYKQTIDGSYYKKYVKTTERTVVGEDGEEVTQTTLTADTPDDADVAKWQAYITASEMSDTRKAIVLEALDTIQKGCIYHQLRSGMQGTPNGCLGGSCDKQSVGTFDFKTQAEYNIEDPVYLDCSYFVKHCYWKGGIEMVSSNTSGLHDNAEFTTISKEDLVPGDIGVIYTNKHKHTIIYMGKNAAGVSTWAHSSNHSDDCKISMYEPEAEYVYRRFGTLANDTKFVGGKSTTTSGGSNTSSSVTPGTSQVKWSDSWQFANSSIIHPDSLNKYVPDNYNGHTVFINPGHGDGSGLASSTPNDPISGLKNQYNEKSPIASAGHTAGTTYKTSSGKTVKEAEYVLEVSMKVKDLLLAKGYAVVMAREAMVNNIENAARSIYANNCADIHVAIHINSDTSGPFWYRPDATQKAHSNYAPNASADEKLGTSIESALVDSLGISKGPQVTGVLTGYCYSTIPCTYIELYGTNSIAMGDFAESHKDQAAQGIVNGIDKYFN